MAAASTDLMRKKKSNYSTTLNGGINDTDQTIALSSASGLPTDTGITLTIDRVDANGVSTPSLRERVTGVISGNNITNAVRGDDNTSAQAHNSGAIVEDIWDAATWNDMVDAMMAGHAQSNGAHAVDTISEKSSGAGVTVDGVLLKDGGITLASAGIFKVGASFPGITDANSNELLKFTQTASAVNEFTMANAAVSGRPKLSVSGSDTDIDLHLSPKGAGRVKIDRVAVICPVVAYNTDLTTGDGKFCFTVPKALAGMNLVGVHARVADTAPVGSTITVQIANVTDSVDMLSTKISIDASEKGSDTAASAAVIDTNADDVAENDLLRIDIDQVGSSTAGKGLVVRLEFALP